jgi:hypothetical protein
MNTRWLDFTATDPTSLTPATHPVRPIDLDLWLGRSFVLGGGHNLASRSSNVILAARYAQTRYLDKPPAELDTGGVHRDVSLLLLSAGLTVRQYHRERYLFRFGVTEDVPIGLLIQVTAGVRKLQLSVNRPYLGVEVARGRYYDGFGYLSASAGFGSFYERGNAVDGMLTAGLDYFTGVAAWKRWRLRQFVGLHATVGIARPTGSVIDLNGEQLHGFSSDLLTGTRRAVLDLRTVLYTPYNLIGFRFAPVLLLGFGTLGSDDDPLFSGRIHSAIAIGLLIRNENLLVNTFQVSAGLFPYVPETGEPGFAFNPLSSFDPEMRDFAFTRPDLVVFQ